MPGIGQGSYGSDSGITFSDMIEEAARQLMPSSPGMAPALTAAYSAGSPTITLDTSSPSFAGVTAGQQLSVDLEVMYVEKVNLSNGTVNVVPGYAGSSEANHAIGTLCYVNPAYTRWDIARAINHELDSLSAPSNGLFQVVWVDVTYIPIYRGYDLGSMFNPASSKILEVSYRIAPPWRNDPLIRKGDYSVRRFQNPQGDFPSGNGIVFSKPGWPGFPIHVTFTAPFSSLVNLTDDITGVAGLPATAADIPPLGAILRLAPGREVERNQTNAEPDARKAPEVPPQALATSVNGLRQLYTDRIGEEADRLAQDFPMAVGW